MTRLRQLAPSDRVWCIAPDVLNDILAYARGLTPAVIEARLVAQESKPPISYARMGSVAVIRIEGVLSKHLTWLSWFFGGTSTAATAEAVKAAASDSAVKAIALYIDSPGGAVSGTADLADAVFAARQRKPVTAFISDIGASGAFWIASQASAVYANESALVGSVGTYSLIYDWSRLFEKEGIRAHVVRAGEFKGMGATGTEITPEQLLEMQRVVDALNRVFVKHVGRGRDIPMDRARALADGRVYVAGEAKTLGLIDGVTSFDGALGELIAKYPAPTAAPKVVTEAPQPALYSFKHTARGRPISHGTNF